MMYLQQYAGFAALAFSLLTAMAGSSYAQQCPQHAHVTNVLTQGNTVEVRCRCDAGYSNQNGACVQVAQSSGAACVRAAGLELRRYKQDVCGSAVGRCFSSRGVALSSAALKCVVGCADVATCPVACGLSTIAVEDVVDRCLDRLNTCFEAALARHAQAVHACQQD